MSQTFELIRGSFRTQLLKLAKEFPAPKCEVQHPEVFWATVEDHLRLAAYDHAVEVAAKALKVSDGLKVHAALRRAGLQYFPARKFTIPCEDGGVVVMSRRPTAQLKEEDEQPILALALEARQG